ncbi:hypothetical protein [Arenimonas daejeonensis]|uniref:hypothetical protein n=1 Tax=Arenimonas daejeonensis TaxID=370777 RepID=UPI0011BF0116|nr:hypothetical protein [Arenimonas daejeonensis]
MILRRLSQSLREQNWTAIVIEFVLLVAGVFLGIQAANWNEQRTQRLQEHSFLAQLHDEISANDDTIAHQMRYLGQVISGGRRALAYLQSGEDCVAACEALLIDFFHASQMWGTPFARAKYEETRRLGFPSHPPTRVAVDDFYSFIDGWDAVTATPPPYRERIRGHFTPEAAQVLWRGCWHAVTARSEELRRDCEADLEPWMQRPCWGPSAPIPDWSMNCASGSDRTSSPNARSPRRASLRRRPGRRSPATRGMTDEAAGRTAPPQRHPHGGPVSGRCVVDRADRRNAAADLRHAGLGAADAGGAAGAGLPAGAGVLVGVRADARWPEA